ncbi:hypothetical protein [Pelosinus sp. UFO1]|uniref:hypothetical protein n=1 Tax=Pelosinus sp. UFO1 TaxID=484770 RepID=UPI0004D0E639|nr:hypothetical protein [Pelosinus sp. UFO1]AIF54157.1 hypothetical protein UFO1_4622 [Pelosinus sp. UFO1]
MKQDTKKTISARVNESITDILSEQDLPTSQIVEAGIIHFLKLKEEEKIAFIAENSAEVTNEKDLVVMQKVWPDILRDYTGTTRFKDLIEIAKLAKSAGVGFHVVRESLKSTGMLSIGAGIVAGSMMSLAKVLMQNKKK